MIAGCLHGCWHSQQRWHAGDRRAAASSLTASRMRCSFLRLCFRSAMIFSRCDGSCSSRRRRWQGRGMEEAAGRQGGCYYGRRRASAPLREEDTAEVDHDLGRACSAGSRGPCPLPRTWQSSSLSQTLSQAVHPLCTPFSVASTSTCSLRALLMVPGPQTRRCCVRHEA